MPEANIPDKDLVRQVVNGQTDAYGQLVERHIHGAYAIAYARAGNVADAEDAVQEAFLRGLEKLRSLRDPAKFGSWLLSITRNEAARVVTNRSKSERVLPGTTDVVVPDAGSREMSALVRERVMRLPEQHREVLLLHYFTGRSTNEIAELLGLRRGAVLKRLQRAREQLAATMLRDLEAARPPEASFTKQVTRIAALAGALAMPNAISAAAIAAPAAGFGSKLAAAGAVAVVAIVGLIVAFSQTKDRANAAAPLTANDASPRTDSFVVAAATSGNTDPVVEAAPSASEAPVVEIAAASPAAEADTAIFRDGVWIMDAGPPNALPRPYYRMYLITHQGNMLTVTSKDDHKSAGTGTVANGKITLTIQEPNKGPGGLMTFKLAGPYDAASNEFELLGEYTSATESYTYKVEEKTYTQEPSTNEISGRFWRANEQWISGVNANKLRQGEFQKLTDSVLSFASAHDERFPQTLEELVPEYLPSVAPYQPEAGVTLVYTPPAKRALLANVRPTIKEIFRAEDPYRPDLPLRDKLMAAEDALEHFWGDEFIVSPVLIEAVYTSGLNVVATQTGIVGGKPYVMCEYQPIIDNFTPEELREAKIRDCHHNVASVGAVARRFMGDNAEGRAAGGILSLYEYHQYFAKRAQAHCPGSPSTGISYQLLFPAATGDEIVKLHARLFGLGKATSPEELDDRRSHIPLVIETNECNGTGKHHVFFMNGHIEFIDGPLEDDPDIAPFLSLR